MQRKERTYSHPVLMSKTMRSIGKFSSAVPERVARNRKRLMRKKTLGKTKIMIFTMTMRKKKTRVKMITIEIQSRSQDFRDRLKLVTKRQTTWKNVRQLDLRQERERSVKRLWKSNATLSL